MAEGQNTATEIFNNTGTNNIMDATKSSKPSVLKEVGNVLTGNIGDQVTNIIKTTTGFDGIEAKEFAVNQPVAPKASEIGGGMLEGKNTNVSPVQGL